MEPGSPSTHPAARRAPWPRRVLVAALLAGALGLLFKAQVGWFFPVVSGSMEPTVATGEWVYLDYDVDRIERFDIVAFTDVGGGASIKRVIGLSGDRVRMEDRVLYVNDVPIERTDERTFDAERQRIPMLSATETMDNGASYGVYNVGGTLGQVSFDEITVREDHVFVMGDNRDNSSDGRCWGQVPIANIKGTALFIFFSRDRRDGSVRWDRLFDAIR